MFFGAIPGVSMLTLAAILLPFTAGLEPAQGVMLFAVIYCTGTYGGAITAILFNIPGSAENAPTAFDGYPMTQKGQSGKAVGAAVFMFGHWRDCISPCHDGRNRAIGKLGDPQYWPPRNLCACLLWSCGCLLCWSAHHLERVDVGPNRIVDRNDWSRSRGWHQPLQFRYDRTWPRASRLFPQFWGSLPFLKSLFRRKRKPAGNIRPQRSGMTFPSFIELWMQ